MRSSVLSVSLLFGIMKVLYSVLRPFSSGVLHCGPQNLTLNSSDQMILLTWEDDPSCSAVHDVLTYELVVLIADKQVLYVRINLYYTNMYYTNITSTFETAKRTDF